MPSDSVSFAVVLNAHARGVNQKVLETVAEIIPPENLFLSRSAEEGDRMVDEILGRGFDTVFTGGGDGTVVHFINQVVNHGSVDGDGNGGLPNIGILRLGTGNALAEMVSSGNYLCDLKSFVRNRHEDYHVLGLVAAEGRRFPFASVGWDAEVLNDYDLIKEAVTDSSLAPMFNNVGGYFAAFFMRTVPRRISQIGRSEPVKMRVTNTGGRASLLGPDGEEVETFESGDVLYDGKANCVIVGTCPFYGYGFKVLPFANASPRSMQVRVVTMSLPQIFARLPRVWKGKYRGPGLVDFRVESVAVELNREMPYQEAGDARGHRSNIEFGVSNVSVNLVRFI